MATTKRSTGIAGLDLVLNGGFSPGTRIVIAGSPLSGLELLAQQFWQAEEQVGTYLMLDTMPGEDMIDAKGMDPAAIVAAMGSEKIVVDSLSTLISAWGIDTTVQFILEDTRDIIARGASIVYLLYTGMHNPSEEAQIMRAADVYLSLREQVHGNEFERTLAVEKLKDSDVPQRVIPYHITSKGLELSTTSRVV